MVKLQKPAQDIEPAEGLDTARTSSVFGNQNSYEQSKKSVDISAMICSRWNYFKLKPDMHGYDTD
ncbi:endoglucanase 12 [Dorcoceras hygrometricum]|uniref:Endoglucanase 12 n=1 Tax=Dorcoceras hygrometricum TaxID=472368 RepID=A0A2Z7APQ4_9LAMI|nr:endoglucanase 12 [Dorcoceras hygrometricum]